MSDKSQTRSEAASPRRRQEARQRGQVASSSELATGLSVFSMLLLLLFVGEKIGHRLWLMFIADLQVAATQREWGFEHAVSLGRASGSFLIHSSLAVLCGGFVIGALGYILQIGIGISPEALSLKASRISPSQGSKRIFSYRGLVRTAISLMKFLSCGSAIVALAYFHGLTVLTKPANLWEYLTLTWEFSLLAAILGALALLAVGGIDFAFQRWQHEEDLKMTRQEVKEETKENEGDPQVKGKIRRLQAEAANLRTLNDVPKASVVITNPTHFAVAIQYDQDTMLAPRVVAKGKGVMAQRIKRRAVESGVPVVERKAVARALFAMTDVGTEIPASLFRAVAEILAHVYKLNRSAG